jgi:hypothetical protein
MDLFSVKMQQQVTSWSVFGNMSLDLFITTLDERVAVEVLEESGVMRFWI